MRFSYLAVERIPKQLSPNIVYHSEEFELGALLCACGCGHRVMLLVPDSHQVTSEGGMATVRPSIAVCDAPCKSHYYVNAGRVEWLPAFTDALATSVMRHQIDRHAFLKLDSGRGVADSEPLLRERITNLSRFSGCEIPGRTLGHPPNVDFHGGIAKTSCLLLAALRDHGAAAEKPANNGCFLTAHSDSRNSCRPCEKTSPPA